MIDEFDLPTDRPMPEHMQDALWSRLTPELASSPPERRSKPAAIAVAVGVLAVATVTVTGLLHGVGPITTPISAGSRPVPGTPLPDPGDVRLTKDCVANTRSYGIAVPVPDSWRPGATIDADAADGFMVIRNDTAAAVCGIAHGKASSMMGADVDTMTGKRQSYAKLTDEHPFAVFTGVGGADEPTRKFGIATADVAAVSVVGPGGSRIRATLRDGTFAVRIDGLRATDPDPDRFHLEAVMKNGSVVEGPLH
jgi:hypothetical protein